MSAVEKIKAAIHTHELVAERVSKTPKGPDGQGRYLALCPFHEDTHESFRILDGGGFTCFACGAKGGDVIDLYAQLHALDVPAAIRELSRQVAGETPARRAPRLAKPEPNAPDLSRKAPPGVLIPEHEIPQVDHAIELQRVDSAPFRVTPSAVHVYRLPNGAAHHVILREERNRRKAFYPARWDGTGWWSVAQDTPRKLYGLERLGEKAAQIVIVEGEKAADAASARLHEGLPAVTWPGGARAVDNIDWAPLHGRRLLLWPDNDAPGRAAMDAIARKLSGHVQEMRIIEPKGLVEKGDAADVSPDVSLKAWLRERVSPWVFGDEADEAFLEREVAKESPELADENEGWTSTQAILEARHKALPFHILGQRGDMAYFLKTIDGRVVARSLTSLQVPAVLITLAPASAWQRAFTGVEEATNKDGTINWRVTGMAAQSHIVSACEQLPEYDPARTQGRGCWPHHGTIAFNRGDQIEIDGKTQIDNYADGIVFTRGAPMRVLHSDPFRNEEGQKLQDLLNLCPWVDPASSMCLAGWIALAPICGALEWRPHIWLTGPSGSGKSTIMDSIIIGAIGKDLGVRVAGSTTEAGLRQAVGHDAIPILIDEAEPDAKSMKSILDLARSASSGDIIVRGSSGQDGAMRYQVRSAFCFSAINPAIAKFADETRITRLVLRRRAGPAGEAKFAELTEARLALINDRTGPRLAARMIRNVKTVLRNIKIMEDAIANHFGSRRLAQQYGALLGGAWSLVDDEVIEESRAAELAENVPNQSVQIQSEEDDIQSMTHHMLAWMVEVSAKGHRRTKVTAGELIERGLAHAFDDGANDILQEEASLSLARWGMRVSEDQKAIIVARNHPGLKNQLFKDTPWSGSYIQQLSNLDGAHPGGQMRFAGDRYSTVIVPVSHFGMDEAEE